MKNLNFLWSGTTLRGSGILALALVALFAACSNPAGPSGPLGGPPNGDDNPTVTSVSVSSDETEVAKGGTATFSAEVIGTNDPPQTVTWSIDEYESLASGTSIGEGGVLVVDINETVESLTIRATSTFNTGKSGTAAITVSDEPATVTSVSVDPAAANVVKGRTYTFSAEVVGTNGPTQTVTWSVEGASDSGTTIDENSGELTVAAGESAASFTVKATSILDPDASKSGTATLTLVTPTVTSVTVSPDTISVAKGGTQTFTATVAGTHEPDQDVIWSIVESVIEGTGITGGVLTVAAGETATSLTIKATSTVNTSKSGTATVTIPQPTVDTVTVSPDTANVVKGGTQTFSATVAGTNSPAQTVTWTVSGGGAETAITSTGGVLTVAAGETAASLTVTATSTVDISKFGTATVTVINPELTISGLGAIYTNETTVQVGLVNDKNIGSTPVAYGVGTVTSGGSLTVALENGSGPWTESGSYYIGFRSDEYIHFVSKTKITFSGGTAGIAYNTANFELYTHSMPISGEGLPPTTTLNVLIYGMTGDMPGGPYSTYAAWKTAWRQIVEAEFLGEEYVNLNDVNVLDVALYKNAACTQEINGTETVESVSVIYTKLPLADMMSGGGPGMSTGFINGTVTLTGYTDQEVSISVRYSNSATDYNGNMASGIEVIGTTGLVPFSIPYTQEFLTALQSGPQPQYLHFELFIKNSGYLYEFFKYIGYKQVQVSSLDNADLDVGNLGTVSLASITLGGTITVTYNGDPVPRVLINAYNGSQCVGVAKIVDSFSSNVAWSLLLPVFDTPTAITLQIYGENSEEEPLFGPISETVSGVSNANKNDVEITLGNNPH